jgi:hypothetical protein
MVSGAAIMGMIRTFSTSSASKLSVKPPCTGRRDVEATGEPNKENGGGRRAKLEQLTGKILIRMRDSNFWVSLPRVDEQLAEVI